MTREFSDELLSAHLDGELTDAERAEVENHLASSEADRQLYQDLMSLRGEMASLPRANVSPDFADRVVRAALSEAEKQNEARGLVSRAPPVERHFWRRWIQGAVASAVALAACALLALLVGRNTKSPGRGEHVSPIAVAPVDPKQAVAAVAALPDQLLAALANAAPRNRDAVVLRLKAGKDVSLAAALDAALEKAGIAPAGAEAASLSALVQESYAKLAPASTEANALAAADALFIEAPLESLRSVFVELGTAVKDPLELHAQGKLALVRGRDDDRAEGEGSSTAAKPFAQRLDSKLFHLQDLPANGTATASVVAALKPDQAVRVLILVEP